MHSGDRSSVGDKHGHMASYHWLTTLKMAYSHWFKILGHFNEMLMGLRFSGQMKRNSWSKLFLFQVWWRTGYARCFGDWAFSGLFFGPDRALSKALLFFWFFYLNTNHRFFVFLSLCFTFCLFLFPMYINYNIKKKLSKYTFVIFILTNPNDAFFATFYKFL